MIGTDRGFDRLYDVFAFTKHILIPVTIIIGYAMIRQLVRYDRTRSTGFVARNGLRSLGIVTDRYLECRLFQSAASWLYHPFPVRGDCEFDKIGRRRSCYVVAIEQLRLHNARKRKNVK
jgi:hypothetical protein